MLPPPKDRLEEWLSLPILEVPHDSRFDVRRARPEEYERVYDLVDLAFGATRSRREYDWLYRKNPSGQARCWVSVDRETGEFVSSEVDFPWPLARGEEPIDCVFGGDAATHPLWQRMGIPEERRLVWRSHPWSRSTVVLGEPNEKTRGQLIKFGHGDMIQGPVPAAAFVHRSRSLLERMGYAPALAAPASRVLDAAFGLARSVALRPDPRLRIEPIPRFDASLDPVSERTMAWTRFWSPHDASFLNWRYLDNPASEYVAHALLVDDRPVGYTVVRLGPDGATLAELAVPSDPPALARALVCHAIWLSREAGSPLLKFFSPPAWRHWPLLRRCGFLKYPSTYYLTIRGGPYEPEIQDLASWQLVPGDRDYR